MTSDGAISCNNHSCGATGTRGAPRPWENAPPENTAPSAMAMLASAGDTAPQARRMIVADMRRRYPALALMDAESAAMLPALIRRIRHPASKLLLCLNAPLGRFNVPQMLALRLADGVVVPNDLAAAAVAKIRGSDRGIFNAPGPYQLSAFQSQPVGRAADAAHRIVICDALAPDGDALHILQSVALWAERHVARHLDLSWAGTGDLRGVLAAQCLPETISQSFTGEQTPAEMAAHFARHGVMVAAAPARSEILAQAMASGLVVVFDRDYAAASALLRDGQTGIGFNGGHPEGLQEALGIALTMQPGAMDAIRVAARMRVQRMDMQGFRERVERAADAVMRGATRNADIAQLLPPQIS